jgi:hypothetical protein
LQLTQSFQPHYEKDEINEQFVLRKKERRRRSIILVWWVTSGVQGLPFLGFRNSVL